MDWTIALVIGLWWLSLGGAFVFGAWWWESCSQREAAKLHHPTNGSHR